MRQKSVYLACFILHFLLIITVSVRETLWLVARGLTIFPSSSKSYSARAEKATSAARGHDLAASSALRQALATYLHLAGIERGYGYFAPNVPESYKLVLELHYPDGRVEYQLPRVNRAAAGLRVAVREYMVKMLAYSTWRENPDVTMIRAVFGSISLPSISEFEHGKRESYEFLYAYDFSRTDKATEVETP